jgi:putative membrane protein
VSVSNFPALNAGLNSLSTLFILAGWWLIAHERKRAHITFMVLALVTSSAFLGCYLYYHFHVGHVPFTEQGWPRTVYFPLLISHLILAVVIVPMVVLTVVPALRARFDAHRRIGRWTMPVWLYVSVTGVLVYLMLYVWFPSTAAS